MRRHLFNFAAAASLVLFVGTAGLWAYSHWRFTRISFIYGLRSSDLQDRRITFLAWSEAAELMIQTEGLEPDADCTADQLRQEMKRMDVQVYQQEGISASEEPDAGRLWGFHYRSPQEAQAMNLSYSAQRAINGKHYWASIRDERAFFVCWWLITGLLAVLPALVARKWLQKRRRLRMGQCLGCGYNLAGNASGVCPECGTPIEQHSHHRIHAAPRA